MGFSLASRGIGLCTLSLAIMVGCDDATEAPLNLVCEPSAHDVCECPVGTGHHDCNESGTAWGECFCPVQNAVLAENALAVELGPESGIVLEDGGVVRVPLGGNQDIAELEPGDVLVNWGDPPLLRRVNGVSVEDDVIVLQTELGGVNDAFSELDVELESAPINLYGALPVAFRETLDEPRLGISGGPAGLSFGASGELIPNISFSDDSRIWFRPNVDVSLHSTLTDTNFRFGADLDAGFDITTTVGLEAAGTLSAELELIEAAIVQSPIPFRPPEIRLQIGSVYFSPKLILGCELTVEGSAELTTRVHTSFDLGGTVTYDDDRDEEWQTSSHANVDGGANLVGPPQWEAGVTLTCYVRPRIEMTFLEVVTGYVQAGPEAETSVIVGPTNAFSVDAAVTGTVGAEVGLDLGEVHVTVAEASFDIFRYETNLYYDEFTICGDGYRQHGDSGDFHEECDTGVLFSDPTCTPDCECAEGFVPQQFNDSVPGQYRAWGATPTLNVCVSSCGNGVHEPDEGEACDPGLPFPDCQAGVRSSCASDCSREIGVCGDGITDRDCAEVCDDGNTDDCDGCSSDCMRTEICGDGITSPQCGEACDGYHPWGCTDTCLIPGCGNGAIEGSEACDDGNHDDCDDCHNDCTVNARSCGDRHVCDGEVCDEGGDTWNCDSDCTRRACNDGHLNGYEYCDAPSATCDDDCTPVECGDRNVNEEAGEVCDGESWGCDADCTLRECGDGYRNPQAEACDDGNTSACLGDCLPDCSDTMVAPGCGNGLLDCGEGCDDGPDNGTCGYCAADCSAPIGICGDGVAECGEACDDGNHEDGDGCTFNCLRVEECGNHIPDVGEACDDGDVGVCAGECREDCSGLYATCGDGVIGECEICENSGDGVDTGCSADLPNCNGCRTCTGGDCGDGVVSGTEVCEPTRMCRFTELPCINDASCGATGGSCDPLYEEGHCNETCTGIQRCGNGIREGSESCDDGNMVDGDGCPAFCIE
jgi:cysteine-rich repeat protein